MASLKFRMFHLLIIVNSARLNLVLDCSGSMDGQPMAQLQSGLKLLEEELKQDVIVAKRVRLLAIKYGGCDECELYGDWCDAMDHGSRT